MPITGENEQLLHVIDDYLRLFPDESLSLELLRSQLKAGEHLNDRKNFVGHICGSGLVLSPDRSKVLLIHHKSLGHWMQPGGHWDEEGETDPLAAAKRETIEETGVRIGEYLPVDPANTLIPFDLETHYIPDRPARNEPEHYHHDFRYVFVAADERIGSDDAAISDTGWFPLDAPECQFIAPIIAKLHRSGII